MLDSIVSLASDLISVPSTRESPEKLHEVLDTALKTLPGFKFKKFINHDCPSLLIYNRWPENGRFKVILNAHLDVVPGRPEQYSAKVKDKKLTGRGAIDMKAAGAAEIIAFKNAAPGVNYPLALQLVTDEEIGGHFGTKYQISQGILTDFYLCGEFSDLGLCCDTKGVLWIKLTAHGKKAHGAFLWNGVNAITKLSEEITAIKKLFPVPLKEAWKTTCNFGVIVGGNTVNQVPDTAGVTMDIRHISTDLSKNIIAKIKSHLIYSDTVIEIIEDEPYNHADKNHPLVKLLSETVTLVTGNKADYVKFHGASDARHYSAAGCTALDIGPAGEGLHGDYEWVDLKSLGQFYRVLEKFLFSIKI